MIINDGDGVRILMGMRRDEGGVWEFPGGKQEKEETLEECLQREWREELDLEISVGQRIHISKIDEFICHFFVGTICDMSTMRVKVHERVELYSIAAARNLLLFEGDDTDLNALQRFVSTN